MATQVRWTPYALEELQEAYDYMELKWTEKEIVNFSVELDEKLALALQNPNLFQVALSKSQVRRMVVRRIYSLYYREENGGIEVLSFWDNRKNPKNNIIN